MAGDWWLGLVHPVQDVALHQCLPSLSVCCFPNPGGSLLLCYVILPSSDVPIELLYHQSNQICSKHPFHLMGAYSRIVYQNVYTKFHHCRPSNEN